MLCQNCQKNEADRAFIITWMGKGYQVHVCNECLEQMWQYAGAVGMRDNFKAFTGWWPGRQTPRELGQSPFPADAGAEVKLRLRLSALRARLEEAEVREDYEEAAKLRDSIARVEQEEYSHES